MTDEQITPSTEDPPSPALVELEQRDVALPAVPVQVVGSVLVQNQPNRAGACTVEYLGTTQVKILSADMRRAVATLIGDADWLMRGSSNGLAAKIPARTPVVITHAGQVWASVASGTAELTVITELYAQ